MVNNNVGDLLNSDIQDPSDFPPHSVAPGLRELDSALRCKICSELYEAPVILACGHCFCSLCIRCAMADKAECPTCRKPANDTQLRANLYMEEVVAAWNKARSFVLRWSKEEESRTEQSSNNTAFEGGTRPVKRRKLSAERFAGSSDVERLGSEDELLRSNSTERSKAKIIHRNHNDLVTSNGEPSSSSRPADVPLVDCPVCAKQVPFSVINQHIDGGCRLSPTSNSAPSPRMKSKTAQKTAWSKILNGVPVDKGNSKGKGKATAKDSDLTMSPLPKVSYVVLKDKQIRDLLAQSGLSTSGERNVLVARHQRWVYVYNANLDRGEQHRKRVSELRASMKQWDERHNDQKKGGKEVVKDVVQYQKQNKAHFNALIEQARPKAPDKSPPTNLSVSEPDGSGNDSKEGEQPDA